MSNTIKITDYNSVENLNNTDILLINQNGENKKVTKEKLLEDVTTQIEGVTTSLNDLTQDMANKQDINYQQIADGTDLNNLKAFGKRYCTINNLNARSCINIPRTNVLSFELYMPQTSPPVDYEPNFISQILVEWNGNIWTRCYNVNSTTSKWSNWVLIGGEQKSLDSGWQTLPLGIATIGAIAPQYRKIGDELALKGYFVGITSTSDLVGTLPSGNRPLNDTFIPILSNNLQIAKLRINNNGTIYVVNDANNYASGTVYSLDGITFKIG